MTSCHVGDRDPDFGLPELRTLHEPWPMISQRDSQRCFGSSSDSAAALAIPGSTAQHAEHAFKV